MKTLLMCCVMAGCVAGMTAVAQDSVSTNVPLKGEGRRELRERRPMVMEGREGGDALLLRALNPDSPVAKKLGLSKEQVESLKNVVKGSGEEMKALQEKMEQAAKKQAAMMIQNTPDESAVLKGVEDIGALRTEIAKVMTRKILAAQKVLTSEQREILRAMVNARMMEMREKHLEGKGPGGASEGKRKGKEEERPVASSPVSTPAPASSPEN